MADLDQLYTALRNADAAGDVEAATKLAAHIKEVRAAPEKSSALDPVLNAAKSYLGGAGNVLAGAVRGAGSIGATILAPYDMAKDAMDGKGLSLASNRQRRKDMDEGLRTLGADPDSFAYGAGKLGGEIAGTAGMGGVLANGVRAVAPGATALADAIGTAGFKTAGGMGTRMAGGAINGAASAGLVNPHDAGYGAAIGGALPPALKGLGTAGGAVAGQISNALTPEKQRIARMIAETAGAKSPEEMAMLAEVLQQRGPSLIPGLNPTVPQIVQTPAMSQMQRTAKNLSPILASHEIAQDAARRAALNRISPVSGTVQQAADNAGNAISTFGINARNAASKDVTQRFESVDPFGETAFHLPIEDMQAAQSKFLGAGTFGTGAAAQQAIDTAKKFGQEQVAAVKPLTSKQQQDLVLAVRAAGGINPASKSGQELAGEIRNLRESGLSNMTNKNGVSIERMAEKMHESGFLPDNDPATLLNLLQESAAGNKVFAGGADDAYQRAFEHSMGEPPGASVVEKTVPFQTVQNLRSSLNEKWKQAVEKGSNKEAAALNDMIAAIDGRVNAVAEGGGKPGEYFPPDIVNAWRQAIGAHAEKKARFETGPQIGMFRNGMDGQASIQAAEIPSKFFSARGSQTPDIQSFLRLAGDNNELKDALKNYAITDLASQSEKTGGALSNAKVNGWLDARAGALNGLFDGGENATMRAVGGSLQDAAKADFLGKAVGSNTAQNAAAIYGLLGNPYVGTLSHKIPFGKSVLQYLKEKKADQVSGLLANSDETAQELLKLLKRKESMGLLGSSADALAPMTYRGAPLLWSDQ